MKIEQSFVVNAERADVWGLIRDPVRMVACVPGCEEIEQLADDSYRAAVIVSVGPIKARFNLIIDILEEVPGEHVRSSSQGEEGGRASMVKSLNDVRLRTVEDGATEISYAADVEISGRLGRYGSGMMQKIAVRLAAKFEDTFKAMAEEHERSVA